MNKLINSSSNPPAHRFQERGSPWSLSWLAFPMAVLSSLGVCFFIMAEPVFAQTAALAPSGPPSPPSFGATLSRMLPMFALIFFIFYFLVIRPQDKKLKAQQALLADLKRGETVITSAGIIGRIASIDDESVHLEVGTNAKLRIEKSHILRKYKKEQTEKPAQAGNGN